MLCFFHFLLPIADLLAKQSRRNERNATVTPGEITSRQGFSFSGFIVRVPLRAPYGPLAADPLGIPEQNARFRWSLGV